MCDHGREKVNTRVLSMFFRVAKFESRLAFFLFAPEICQMAGFRSFYYHIPFYSPLIADTIDYNKTVKAQIFL